MLDPTATFFATSINPKYKNDCMNPMPGDLVISSFGEIRRLARRDDRFSKHYLILGTVIGSKEIGQNIIEEWKKGRSFE